jgi:hypothetical protein
VAETSLITLRYRGQSSGEGPLTLGQDNMIRCILHDEPMEINKHAQWPVPPEGIELDAAINALRTLAERHEALRTLYPEARPDHQPARQVVHAEGEFEVAVVELGSDENPDEVAEDAGRRNRAVRFDLTADFPLRCTLVTSGGRPVRLSVVVCHAAADGFATAMLVGEWSELVAGNTLDPVPGPTPRELAEQERSASGARRTKASLRHWERILMEGPQAVFADDSIGPSAGLLPTLVLRSVSAAGALAATAQRTGASPSSVMLAAYAALIAHRADQPKVVVAALSSNRHRPGLEQYVGTLAQDALMCLDTDAEDFDALIKNAGAASLAGFWHSTFDSEAIWHLIDETAYRRGARFARHVVLNDLSVTVPESATRNRPNPPTDPELTWFPAEYIPARILLNLWRLRGCIELSLHADPQLFGRDDTERFALGLMRILEASAARTVRLDELTELTGIERARREGGRWLRIEDSWIDLHAMTHLLDAALDKRPSLVELRDGRLIARIAQDGRTAHDIAQDAGPLTPEQAHHAVMDVLFSQIKSSPSDDDPAWAGNSGVSGALSGWETARAPHEYVIHDGSPLIADDPESWSALPVIAQGDGRAAAG